MAPEEADQPFTPLVNDYSVLTVSEAGFRRRLRDGTVQQFDAEGILTSITDRNGNATLFGHAGTKLTSITDPVGLKTVLAYAGDTLSQITDPAGRLTGFQHDAGNLTKITDPDAVPRTFAYDYQHESEPSVGVHLLTAQTFKRGNDASETNGADFSELYQYDKVDGRIRSGTRVDGETFSLTPAQVGFLHPIAETTDPNSSPVLDVLSSPDTVSTGNALDERCGDHTSDPSEEETTTVSYVATASHTDFKDKRHIYAMTKFGQYEDTKVSPRTPTKVSRSNNGGRITAESDGEGNLVCYVRDSFANVIRQTDFPDGEAAVRSTRWDYEFNADGELSFNIPVEITDEVNRVTRHTLDGNGNIVSTTITDGKDIEGNPRSVVVQFSYDDDGLTRTVTDARGNITTSSYDSYGRLTLETFADGSRQFIYDDLTGYVSESIDANGNRTVFVRDSMNRVAETRNIGREETPTRTATTGYDSHGNVIREINRDDVITNRSYDVMDRPSQTTADVDGLAYVTRYGYDLSELRPDYNVTAEGGDVFVTQHPTGHFTVTASNEFNELATSYDQLGRPTKYIRDDAGRVETVIPPHGLPIVKTLDERGRVKVETGPLPDQQTTYTYDDVNRLVGTTVKNTTGNQVTTFQYNVLDDVAMKIDAEDNLYKYFHDAAGNQIAEIAAAETPDELVTSYTFDAPIAWRR